RRYFRALEQRRLRAARLLKRGVHQSEVARAADRLPMGPDLPESGARRTQTSAGCGRPEQDRARAEAWATSSGLRNQFVDLVARGPPDRRGMRSPLPCLASLAHSAAVGLELPASSGAGAGAGRRKDPAVEAEALAGD